MTLDTVLARGRARAEQDMVDTCIIEVETGETTDEQTGDVTITYSTVYSGRCKLGKGSAAGDRAAAAEGQVVILKPLLKLPIVGSEQVARGHRVTMTAARFDAAAVGRRYTVKDEAAHTAATARRLVLEEVT